MNNFANSSGLSDNWSFMDKNDEGAYTWEINVLIVSPINPFSEIFSPLHKITIEKFQ